MAARTLSPGRGPASPAKPGPKPAAAPAAGKSLEARVADAKRAVAAKPQNKKKFSKNKDTIDTLKNSLDTKPKFSKMVEYSVDCLKNLAVDEVSVEEMIEEGVLDSLLRVLKLNPYNEQIQKMINDTISAFCLNERLAAMIAQKMGTAPFVHSMTKHVEPETLISTTATVNHLLKGESKEVVETFTRGGMIGALKKVVEGARKVEVAEEAVEGLNRISHASPISAQAVWDSGVMEPVLAYWKEHLDEPRLTKDAVGLLYNVGKNNPKAVEALKKMGAVDTLMEALELHPDNEDIAKVGVDALKLFTNQSDVGAALLVTAGNNKATAAAASKLCSLLLVPENVDYMSKHEGIPWLIAAVKAATGQEGEIAHNILKAGTRGLGRMATSEDKIYEIMKHGGVKVLVSVLNTHADDDDVASPALHALAKMLTRKPNADFILKSGGLEAAMAFLKQNPDSEQAAQAFLEFAEGLAKYPEHVGSLLPLLPKIVDIINRFGSKPEIAALGMNLLGRMAVSEEAMAKIVDAGGLSAPIAVLQHHHDNAKVAKPAVMLLETATMLPTTVEPLRNLGAVKAVSQAMGDSPDDPELQEMGARTLATVAGKKDLADALNELKKIPKDPSKSDGKYPAALVPPMTLVSALAADEGKNGIESRDYLIKNGGVPALLAVFDAAQRLPANDENRLKLLRGAAKALTGLATDKGALSEMAKKQFGKVLNDEAERTGDPELLKLADKFQQVSGGAAGGGDPDAERERQLAEALDEIKKLPKDPSHSDGKYPAALGEPTSLINESMDDPVTGDKSREYLGEHGAVQRLCAEWDALSKLPPSDPHKKKILKDAAEALYKLKDEPGALDHMSKVGFGKLLRDEAVKTGDRDLKRLADEFAKLPDGAGGADQDYSDPSDRKALARALEEIAKAPQTLASGKDPSRVTIPAAFLNNGLDDPSNRDWLGNNGAIKKLIDAWEAMNKLPDGPEKRKGMKNIAEALLKLAPTNGAAQAFANRGFVKKLEDEAARMKDPELARIAEQLKKELDPVYGDKNDQKELARALKDLDDFSKAAAKGDPRAIGKVAIPAAFLNGAGDDDKNREWLGNNGGIKKLIDAFEALKNSKDPARKKAMRNIADLLAKMKDQEGPAKEMAARKFGQMLKDEAMRMNDPELIAISKMFDPVGASTGFAAPGTRSGALQSRSPAKAGSGVSPIKREDPAKYKEIARTGGPHALADLLNKNKDNDEFMQTVAPIMADMFDNASDQDLQKMMDDPACVDALCNIMKGNETLATPLSLADLAKATGAGARLKLKPATVKQMLKNNPQAALMKIIGATDDPLLLSNAAKLLGRMAGNDEALAMLTSIATIRELIDAMRRNIKNQEFLRYGAYLLGEFANIEKLRTEIGVEGGIGLLLQITGLYPKNKDLIENCCFALANCSAQHPVNCTFVVASNGINNMIGLMAAYPKAEELLENAVCVLCNIAYDARTKDAVVKAGGAQAIVDTTLNNFDAVELMVSCLRTLGVLAYNKPCSEAIIKAGGVQGIVAAMTVHNDKEDVILMALRVLTNLAAEASDESLATLAQEGAVQAAVEAAIQYGKHHELELASMGCLCNLGLSKSNASMIIKQGCTEAICDAFSIHNYEAKLAEKGCRLIHILTHSTQDLERMLEAKVGDAVLGAMKANGKNKAVLSPALTAVAGLAHGEKSAKKLAEDTPGLIPAIMALLKTNMNDPQIVVDCFKALSALSRAEPNALGMAAMTMAMYNTALQTHSSNTKVLEAAFKFMSNLCVHKSCSELAPGAEVVPSTLVALGIHGKDPATLIFGCKALENMAYGSNTVKDYMKAQGVLQKMKEIQTENPTRDDVRRAAQLVIDALTRIEIDIDFKPLALNTGGDKKKAKEIFHKEEKGPVIVLPKEIRNLLNAGALMLKHSKTAVPRKKHVYVDIELKRLIWKDPKEKKIDPKNTMKVGMIKEVQKGNCTPQLQRKTLMTKKEVSNADCAFAVFGRDRTVDLECNSMEERDKWVNALEILIEYKRGQKAAATVFGTVARA